VVSHTDGTSPDFFVRSGASPDAPKQILFGAEV
jgi:hypothetical protein